MFIDNDWWGHKFVLSKYCNIKQKPILGSMQHGVCSVEEEKNYPLTQTFKQIPFLCNTNFLYERNKIKFNIVAIGAPFLYLDKIISRKENKIGTIVFPPHSGFIKKKSLYGKKIFKDKLLVDHEAFIKNVEKHNSPPYTVSIIHDDYYELSKIYKRKNWKIFSGGNRYNKSFLINIYKIISKHKSAVFCEFTSALYYSMFLGLRVRLAIKSPLSSKKIIPFNYRLAKVDKVSFKVYLKKYPEIFSGKLDITKAKNLAKERMGFDCLKSKDELKSILGWNSNIKIFLAIFLKKIYNIRYRFQ